MPDDLFPGFEAITIDLDVGPIFLRKGGKGPALALLHGFPQTHTCWHRIAPALAEHFTVVCMDLRGYGDSAAPHGDGRDTYSKRTMALDVVEVMQRLGYERFAVAGHDRGARVAYRMALDRPECVTALAVLDIVPTALFWEQIEDGTFSSPHWHFLARPAPEPEREIGVDPAAYFQGLLAKWSKLGTLDAFDPRALKSYRRSFLQPERIHAFCEDYRAGATSDREADQADLAAGRTIKCPVLVIWSDYLSRGAPASAETPPATWRRSFAPQAVEARVEAGHFVAEEDPAGTLEALLPFLRTDGAVPINPA